MDPSDPKATYAIHAAAREGRASAVEALLNVDPNVARRKDDDGRLPIHWAVSSNQKAIVLMLAELKGFDPDIEDDSGWTPLMIAASIKDGDALVDLLLQRGADVNQTNNNGQSALHFVASKSNIELARKLLEPSPSCPASAASTRIRDKRGQYPIHRAAAVGSAPMVKILLKHRSPLNATDNSGYTALHHAIAEGHGDTAVALLREGAELDKRDADGMLPLDLAPDRGVRTYIEREAEKEGIEL